MYVRLQTYLLAAWTGAFFNSILCNRNSSDGLVHFFRFEKENVHFFIFLLILHLCKIEDNMLLSGFIIY